MRQWSFACGRYGRVLNGSACSRRLVGVDLFFSLRLKLVASCSVDGKIKVW